jgi:hypothetical protein
VVLQMSAADREEAPRVLGVEMTRAESNREAWFVDFGVLRFEMTLAVIQERGLNRQYLLRMTHVSRADHQDLNLGTWALANCIRYIERELLAIRAAIPAASTPPSPEPQAEPQRAERATIDAKTLAEDVGDLLPSISAGIRHHGFKAREAMSQLHAIIGRVNLAEPAEHPELKPTNAELVAKAKEAHDLLGLAVMFIVDPQPVMENEHAWYVLKDVLSELERRLQAKEG